MATRLTVTVDEGLKAQAEAVYSSLGQTMTSAVNTFLAQSVACGGFPFEVRLSPEDLDRVVQEASLAVLASRAAELPLPPRPTVEMHGDAYAVPQGWEDEPGDEVYDQGVTA